VAKGYDLLFETDRFNLSRPKEYFINDCCYGDDLATWLRGKLDELGILASEPAQEDWGWYLEVHHQGSGYFIGIGGHAEDESFSNRGEWRLMVEKRRSLMEILTGKNRMTENEEIVSILRCVVQSEPDMKFLGIE
jgi:hypothetical protein